MCWILNGKRKISPIIAARSRDKRPLTSPVIAARSRDKRPLLLSLRAPETSYFLPLISYFSHYRFALPGQATSVALAIGICNATPDYKLSCQGFRIML